MQDDTRSSVNNVELAEVAEPLELVTTPDSLHDMQIQESSQQVAKPEVAPAYAKISSTGYTGNKYFATRKRLSYHPADKQFTGSSTTTTTAPQVAAEPPKPKSTFRTTLPAGFKA